MTEIIETNIIENMSTIFDNLLDYEYLYISIGSKINENTVSIGKKTYMSNAFDQIYPGFLQSIETQNVLFIAIDDFRSRDSQFLHKRKINSLLSPNIKCYLLNQYCSEGFIESFFAYVLDKLSILNFNPKNFMIANFVRFLHIPNKKEAADEMMIPETIQTILNREMYTPYTNCLCQWFGYKPYFYNYIYKYKKFKQNPLIYNKMYCVEVILKNSQKIPCSNHIVLQDETIAYMINNMYSITDANVVSLDIAVSIYDDYKSMGIIVPLKN